MAGNTTIIDQDPSIHRDYRPIEDDYLPIENYGAIGNMRTCALVGMNGSIDWLCYPEFDSPPVFAAILDPVRGGRFQITPEGGAYKQKQFYWPDTNILVTRFLSDEGIGEVIDFMPLPVGGDTDTTVEGNAIIRHVQVKRGRVRFRIVCQPAFLAADHESFAGCSVDRAPGVVTFRSEERGLTLALRSAFPAGARPPGEDEEGVDGTAYRAAFELEAGQSAWFVLGGLRAADRVPDGAGDALADRCKGLFEETLRQWRRWLAKCTYRGCYREQVKRSALALKLMTFEPTGAVIAAPTASLPESIPGTRNWDYRFTFLRDAAFILDALMQIGFTDEADAFITWLVERITPIPPCWRPEISAIPPCYSCADGRLMQPLYTIRGGTHLEGLAAMKETESTAYDGYRRSQPVRFGNAAAGQVQLDLYGELMDALYVYARQRERFISFELWGKISTIVNWVCANWEGRDRSIWEVRGPEQDFVFSKLMCWVAIDRGLRLADLRSLPAENYDTWRKTRDRIYRHIMERGWDGRRKTFVQTYGGTELDASSLLMPMVGFIAPNDDRIVTTIEAIKRPFDEGLMDGDLIYRYDWQKVRDLDHRGAAPESEGTFNLCTFWLIEAMALTRRPDLVEEARVMFERMLGYANHLGLYAEQTGARGEALGNFPQAFTHLGLIKAALILDRALDSECPTSARATC